MYLKTKKSIIEHEKRCFRNPARRACASCGHNVVGEKTVANPAHYGDPGSTDYVMKYPYCLARDLKLDKGNLTCDCKDWIPRRAGGKDKYGDDYYRP